MIGVSKNKTKNEFMKKFTTAFISSMILFAIGCASSAVYRVKILDEVGEPVQGQEICIYNSENNFFRSEDKTCMTDAGGFAEVKIKSETDLLFLGEDGKGGVISFIEISEHAGAARDLYQLGNNKTKTGLRILLEHERGGNDENKVGNRGHAP